MTAAESNTSRAPGRDGNARRRAGAMDSRRCDLAQIHMLAGELQLADDAYRDLMATVCGGVRSAAMLDVSGRQRFIAHLRRCLGRPEQAPARRGVARELTPRERLLWALWMQLADAGAVDTRTMNALDAYVLRQTGVARMQWLQPAQLDAVIEAAKQWLRRMGRRGAGQ